MKFLIGFLSCYWIFSTLMSIETHGVQGSIVFSLLVLFFCLVFIYGWTKQTYLVINDNQVKYVSFFIQRKVADISDIKVITTSIIAGFIKFLCVIHIHNGKKELLQISPVSFSKKTLNEFVLGLKNKNPKIEIHESVNKLIN